MSTPDQQQDAIAFLAESATHGITTEVEAIETELEAEETMAELISHAPLPGLDQFFALGPID